MFFGFQAANEAPKSDMSSRVHLYVNGHSGQPAAPPPWRPVGHCRCALASPHSLSMRISSHLQRTEPRERPHRYRSPFALAGFPSSRSQRPAETPDPRRAGRCCTTRSRPNPGTGTGAVTRTRAGWNVMSSARQMSQLAAYGKPLWGGEGGDAGRDPRPSHHHGHRDNNIIIAIIYNRLISR